MARECQVCGRMVKRGPGGLGIKQHSGKHRRQFEEEFGREAEDYDEVIELLGPRLMETTDHDEGQATLDSWSVGT